MDSGQDNKSQKLNLDERQALSDAYAAVQAEKTTSSFSAFTFAEAVDAETEKISGKGTSIRPNRIDRVSKIKNLLLAAVEKIRSKPPESYINPNSEQDVNTDKE